MVAAAAVSQIGQFEAEMSSDSFQLLGMAERGFLPAALAKRSRHDTPTLGVILSSLGILTLVTFDFTQVLPFLSNSPDVPFGRPFLTLQSPRRPRQKAAQPRRGASHSTDLGRCVPQIVELLNIVYCLAELTEFAAFIALRIKAPDLKRPYRIPLPTWACVLMLLPASVLLLVILVLPIIQGDWQVRSPLSAWRAFCERISHGMHRLPVPLLALSLFLD